MLLTLKDSIDNLCDYTYNFTWQNNKIRPGTIIPSQAGTSYTFSDLVNELRKGKDVHISGNAGKGLGYGMGVDLKHFEGTGKDVLINNKYDERKKHLLLDDGNLRGTIAARCNCEAVVTIEGDVYNGTGLLMQKGNIQVTGDAGMNTGAHLDGGLIIVEGTTGEFAGAYMKKGTLILNDAKGYAGANMKDGVILSKKKVNVSPSIEELDMAQEDANLIMKKLGIGHVEAMSYHKYGVVKERLVRMRDGSVVVRKVGE